MIDFLFPRYFSTSHVSRGLQVTRILLFFAAVQPRADGTDIELVASILVREVQRAQQEDRLDFPGHVPRLLHHFQHYG